MDPTAVAVVECVKVLSAGGNIIHINRDGLTLLEVDSDTCLDGRYYADIWPEETRPRIAQAILDALHGAGSTLEGYCPTFLGTPRWWETSFYVDRIRSGMQTVVIGISRDISAQRHAPLGHQAARLRFSVTAETSSDGVMAIAPGGLCAYCNAAGASLLGYRADELIGRPLDQILHRHSPILYATQSTTPAQFEYQRITHRHGHGMSISCVVYPCTPAAAWCASVLTFAATPMRGAASRQAMVSLEKPALLIEMEAALAKLDEPVGSLTGSRCARPPHGGLSPRSQPPLGV